MSRRIVVSEWIPLRYRSDSSSRFKYSFSLDPESLPHQVHSSLQPLPIFVGRVARCVIDAAPSAEELSDHLLSKHNCLPVIIPSDQIDSYHRFCERYLRPLLYSAIIPPLFDGSSIGDVQFDKSWYDSYLFVNRLFARRIVEGLEAQEADHIWIHDHHFIPLATLLRMRLPRVNLGFYLYSPFSPFKTFCTIPVREVLISALLNFDVLGFNTYECASNFLSCCHHLLHLNHQSSAGLLGIEFNGRKVAIRILPVGVNRGWLKQLLETEFTHSKAKELNQMYKNRTVMVAIGNEDLFRGALNQLLALEDLLEENPEWQGKLVLIQIRNPMVGKDAQEVQDEARAVRDRINTRFQQPDYEPIVLMEDRQLPAREESAYLAIADCCLVRSHLNRIPYTYVVCRQHNPTLKDYAAPNSVIIASEFAGCARSLRGVIRVNPWDVSSVSDGMLSALSMNHKQKESSHEAQYKYIKSHDAVYWANSFDTALRTSCSENTTGKNYHPVGSDMNSRVFALEFGIKKLCAEDVVRSYKKPGARLILVDFDLMMVPKGEGPTEEVMAVVKGLCKDPLNVVVIVSGSERAYLERWFQPCEELCIAAEYGFHFRWNNKGQWLTSFGKKKSAYCLWKSAVENVMQQYTDATDGSYIETKHSVCVWHYEDADPHFGPCQANDLLEDLQGLVKRRNAVVKKGHQFVRVNPQGVNNGAVINEVIGKMEKDGKPAEFVLCIGDDNFDEELFEACDNINIQAERMFACTIGHKPKKAKYYLENTGEVLTVLKALVKA